MVLTHKRRSSKIRKIIEPCREARIMTRNNSMYSKGCGAVWTFGKSRGRVPCGCTIGAQQSRTPTRTQIRSRRCLLWACPPSPLNENQGVKLRIAGANSVCRRKRTGPLRASNLHCLPVRVRERNRNISSTSRTPCRTGCKFDAYSHASKSRHRTRGRRWLTVLHIECKSVHGRCRGTNIGNVLLSFHHAPGPMLSIPSAITSRLGLVRTHHHQSRAARGPHAQASRLD